MSELYDAVRNRNTEEITRLIKAGADVNIANVFGATPLCWAAQKGYEDIAELLRKAGAKDE